MKGGTKAPKGSLITLTINNLPQNSPPPSQPTDTPSSTPTDTPRITIGG